MLPRRDLGGALPEAGRAQPVEGSLGGSGGTIEGRKRGLEAKDGHGAGPLFGDAREIAGSDAREHLGGVGMGLRQAVRSEVAVCLLATFIGERDNTVLDDDQTLACAMSRARRSSAGCRPLISTAS